MSDLRIAAQQALEALEVYATHRGLPGPCPVRNVEYALRAALAQQAEPVEPVAWIQPDHLQKARVAPFLCRVEPTQRCADFVPFWTAPPQQAEPVQEPVAWECREHGDSEWFDCGKESYGINPRRYTYRTLYTTPPKRVPLTEEEIYEIFKHLCNTVGASYKTMTRAVEQAHGIKE